MQNDEVYEHDFLCSMENLLDADILEQDNELSTALIFFALYYAHEAKSEEWTDTVWVDKLELNFGQKFKRINANFIPAMRQIASDEVNKYLTKDGRNEVETCKMQLNSFGVANGLPYTLRYRPSVLPNASHQFASTATHNEEDEEDEDYEDDEDNVTEEDEECDENDDEEDEDESETEKKRRGKRKRKQSSRNLTQTSMLSGKEDIERDRLLRFYLIQETTESLSCKGGFSTQLDLSLAKRYKTTMTTPFRLLTCELHDFMIGCERVYDMVMKHRLKQYLYTPSAEIEFDELSIPKGICVSKAFPYDSLRHERYGVQHTSIILQTFVDIKNLTIQELREEAFQLERESVSKSKFITRRIADQIPWSKAFLHKGTCNCI